MLAFFKKSPSRESKKTADEISHDYRVLRRQTFLGIILCYTTFYICRVSLGIVKQPLIDSGLLSAEQLGYISSALFLVYAFGKFINSFLADYCNIRRTMAFGLLISSAINIAIGIILQTSLSGLTLFILFFLLWGANGWAQSMGPAPGAVALSRWFPKKTRATFYSIFATTPQLGRTVAFLIFGYLASRGAWKEVFIISGGIGILSAVISLILIHDHPEAEGLPSIQTLSGEPIVEKDKLNIAVAQRHVLRNPAIWALAFSCAFIYIAQYAFSDWGVLFLQKAKEYDIAKSSTLIGAQSIFAAAGVLTAGIISDKWFGNKRLLLSLVAGTLAIIFLTVFLFGSAVSETVQAISLFLFSYFLNVLYTILSGILALDIVPRQATGATVGTIGFICYIAASLQNVISGHLMQNALEDGNYIWLKLFWLAAVVFATIIPLFIKSVRRR